MPMRFFALFLFLISPIAQAGAAEKAPLLIGLDADMSSGAAEGGEAIRRGADLAIREINARGGLLGRQLKLVVKDHRGNPARGVDNLKDFAAMDNLVAVMGGIHTPVVLRELATIHDNKLVFLVPWAAGTTVVDNGFEPNYVFRVSVRDQFAGGFLVGHALASGHKRLGLLLEKTGWGRSNEAAIKSALAERGMAPAGIEWFGWGTTDLNAQIDRLRKVGADVIILVANPREGGVAVKNLASLTKADRLPVLSHWGITGGDFFTDNKAALAQVDVSFLQTFSFFDPPLPDRATHLWSLYKKAYPDLMGPGDAPSPVGTAHAYDLVHLLRMGLEKAQSTDRSKVRDALEALPSHKGVMRDYVPPFTPERHDALDEKNFRIARYGPGGTILPVKK